MQRLDRLCQPRGAGLRPLGLLNPAHPFLAVGVGQRVEGGPGGAVLREGGRQVARHRDLAAALAQDDAARANFGQLSFTHRKEWVRWIEEAKKPETRATRLTKTVESLREGKRAR